MQTVALVIGGIGLVAGALGAFYSMKSFRDAREAKGRLERIESHRREQLWALLDLANRAIGDHELLRDFTERHGDSSMTYWLSTTHQAACDLYKTLVARYLDEFEGTFTWSDLARVVKAGGVAHAWQEDFWRTLLAQRSENHEEPPQRLLARGDPGPLAEAERRRDTMHP